MDSVPAISAAQVKLPDEAPLYPRVQDAFISRAPWLAAAFILALAWTLWNSRPTRLDTTKSRWRVTPGLVRWMLIVAWVVLAANNIWQVPARIGPDLYAHYQYVVYIARSWSLPVATDGWEMFQSPLFYSLAAPWYGLLSARVNAIDIVKILRFLPLLCGLAQIEIVYRTSRAVFPNRNDLQMLATTIGGLMPMNIYSSQVLGNEPLAGCLTALLILLSVSLLVEPLRTRSQGFFAVMGLVWGLAILSKVTPLLLAPLLIGVIAVHGRKLGCTWRAILTHGGLVFGTCFLTAGWWFLRNWARLGTPIGTSQASGNVWWQDPSYRTVRQLTSFGISLSRPIYGGVWSLWDTLVLEHVARRDRQRAHDRSPGISLEHQLDARRCVAGHRSDGSPAYQSGRVLATRTASLAECASLRPGRGGRLSGRDHRSLHRAPRAEYGQGDLHDGTAALFRIARSGRRRTLVPFSLSSRNDLCRGRLLGRCRLCGLFQYQLLATRLGDGSVTGGASELGQKSGPASLIFQGAVIL